MKVIGFDEIKDTDRAVKCPKGGFTSYRFLLEKDGMGFTLTRTIIPKGNPQRWHYKNHLEACYCVSGEGLLTDLKTLFQYEIKPGVVYALNNHDDHFFQALSDKVELICVFNPPLVGRELHREDGSYELSLEGGE